MWLQNFQHVGALAPMGWMICGQTKHRHEIQGASDTRGHFAQRRYFVFCVPSSLRKMAEKQEKEAAISARTGGEPSGAHWDQRAQGVRKPPAARRWRAYKCWPRAQDAGLPVHVVQGTVEVLRFSSSTEWSTFPGRIRRCSSWRRTAVDKLSLVQRSVHCISMAPTWT